MATKHKDPAGSGNHKETKRAALPMGSGSMHRIRPRASSPSGTLVAKDHAKTHGPSKSSTMAGDQLMSKHVPNYLKPTVSSKTDAGKPAVGKKQHSHDDMLNKPNPTVVRRRSFDKPVHVISQVHKAAAVHHQSSARVVGNSSSKPNASSSERVSKVVKAVKSQPPLVKTKSLPKGFASSKKEAAKTTMNKASEQIRNVVVTSEAEEEESLDVNVEEELARMESPAELHHLHSPEKHYENTHSPLLEAHYVDDDHANQEKHNSSVDNAEHDEQEHEHVAVAEDDVKVSDEETREVHESQNVNEINGATYEAPSEDDDDTKKEKEEDLIKNADAGVGLTAVKTSPEEVAEGEDEKLSAKSEPAISVVHKRQIGGPINKKESPAYNDVIEETASKLVEKRVNKVRALAGAFETVISLEQPHSS